VSESFVATVGTTGLVKADFNIRLYRDSTRLTTEETAVTVTEISNGDYLFANLPNGTDGYWHSLTYEYPAGVGSIYRWPVQYITPTAIVLPLRETGLVEADLGLALYKDGVLQADTLSSVEVGAVGDYAITGMPATSGDYVLRWSRGGLTFSHGYTIAVVPSYPGIIPYLLDMMCDTINAIPGATDYTGAWVASGDVLALPCRIIGRQQLVKRQDGQEVTSNMKVIIGGFNNLTVDDHRYTLPTRYAPRLDLRAVAVKKVTDELGEHHEVVLLP
jgi:hypothetical protein